MSLDDLGQCLRLVLQPNIVTGDLKFGFLGGVCLPSIGVVVFVIVVFLLVFVVVVVFLLPFLLFLLFIDFLGKIDVLSLA